MAEKRVRNGIVAVYSNPNKLAHNWWRASNIWYIDGNRLRSDVGEEIVLLPTKEA